MDPKTVATPAVDQTIGSEKAEPARDLLSEAFDQAEREVKGTAAPVKAAATEAGEDSAAERAEPEASTEEALEDGDEQAAKPEEEPAEEYTDAEVQALIAKPGSILHIDLKRVPQKWRGVIGATKKVLADGFKKLADERKASPTEDEQDSAKSGPKSTAKAPGLTEAESEAIATGTSEEANNALTAWAERNLPALMKKLGVDPDRAARQAASDHLGDAIGIATTTVPLLADKDFRAEVLRTVKAEGFSEDLQAAAMDGDVRGAALLIKAAAGLAMATYKPKPTEPEKPKPGERATKAAKDLAASPASTSTARASQPRQGRMTLDQAWDAAVKTTGAKNL